MSDRWPLIRRLATEVMGWPIASTYVEWQACAGTGGGFVVESLPAGVLTRLAFQGIGLEWNPFESIADAWLIVEKFRERGLVVVVVANAEAGVSCGIYDAIGRTRGESAEEAVSGGKTAAEAICFASLGTLPEEAPHG